MAYGRIEKFSRMPKRRFAVPAKTEGLVTSSMGVVPLVLVTSSLPKSW
jgi:hypothetical protein